VGKVVVARRQKRQLSKKNKVKKLEGVQGLEKKAQVVKAEREGQREGGRVCL